MLINLYTLNQDNFMILICALTFLGLTYTVIHSYRTLNNATMVSQIDTTRVNEGLPTDMSLTPEDFAANPELAEIFGITDTNTNLDVTLESNEHFEQVQNQIAINNNDNLDEDYFMSLYDDLSNYDYTEIMINIFNYDYIGAFFIIFNYDYIGTILDFI
jgi:hypothetical protein